MGGCTIRASARNLLFAAALCVPRLDAVILAADAPPPKTSVPSEEARDAAQKAAMAGDWARVEAFLASVKPDSEPATHLLAGDLLFAMGRPEAAYPEHQAAAKASLENQGRFEATLDLLALRRFPEACASYAKVPGSFLRTAGAPAIDAYMKIRCGEPAKGLKSLERIFREGHSEGEEALASVFAEQRRFSAYRWALAAASKEGAAAGSAGRALPELLLCGDFSNPWFPVHHEEDAVASWRVLLGARPDDCGLRGRAAIGEMLLAGRSAGGRPGPADLVKARALIFGAFEFGPDCEEEAVAHYAYLDLTTGEDPKPLLAPLEAAVKKFPQNPDFPRYLADRYRESGAEREHRDLLESMVTKFPDDPFAYSRLAILATAEGKTQEGIGILGRGLARRPDSLPLNYLKALLLMSQKNYKDAVDPSVRLLAGLLETQNYHHGWEPGMALLRGALDAKPPLPAGTEWPEVLRQLERLGLAAQAGLFRSSYGCFASGGAAVSMPDEWFAPERVEKAVREARTARPSSPQSQ